MESLSRGETADEVEPNPWVRRDEVGKKRLVEIGDGEVARHDRVHAVAREDLFERRRKLALRIGRSAAVGNAQQSPRGTGDTVLDGAGDRDSKVRCGSGRLRMKVLVQIDLVVDLQPIPREAHVEEAGILEEPDHLDPTIGQFLDPTEPARLECPSQAGRHQPQSRGDPGATEHIKPPKALGCDRLNPQHPAFRRAVEQHPVPPPHELKRVVVL